MLVTGLVKRGLTTLIIFCRYVSTLNCTCGKVFIFVNRFILFSRSGRGGGPPRRSDYRVLISGLPATGSWQDIKDHCREAGDVVYADVFRDGTGVVEFVKRDDMEWAVKNLDDTKFKSHEVRFLYIWHAD